MFVPAATNAAVADFIPALIVNTDKIMFRNSGSPSMQARPFFTQLVSVLHEMP
jgi:hypothetical protein